jgi:uncharacterized phage protein (TIGR02220 family)
MTQKEPKPNHGFIALYRTIQDHWLWEDKPFSRGQAWIDLLLLVNHKDQDIMLDGNLYKVERGEHVTSTRKLGERWGWSRNKVTKFLAILESAQMVHKKSDSKKTVIKVLNYEEYQGFQDLGNKTQKTAKGHRKDAERTQKDTNNNDNNDNNVKDILSGKEKSQNKEIPFDRIIEYLNNKTGKNYKSTTGKTRDLIKARYNEGFTEENFRKVIDNKASHWLGDEKMDRFLRPETLFGNKFEGYLNEDPSVEARPTPKKMTTQPQFDERELPDDYFDQFLEYAISQPLEEIEFRLEREAKSKE